MAFVSLENGNDLYNPSPWLIRFPKYYHHRRRLLTYTVHPPDSGREKEAPPVTCPPRRRSRLFGVPGVHTHTHIRAGKAEEARVRTHVKYPRAVVRIAQGGPRWRRRRRCCRCRRRLTIGDSPGSAAASFPHRRARTTATTTTAYTFTPRTNSLHASHRCKLSRCPRRTITVMCVPAGWRRTRAPVAYIVNFYQPPPAGHPHRSGRRAAVASRTRTLAREYRWPPERTRAHSTEWNAVDVVRCVCSCVSSYTVTVRARHVNLRREITR